MRFILSVILPILLVSSNPAITFAQAGAGNSNQSNQENRADDKTVTRKAMLKSMPQPDYPKEAKAYNIAAVVKLRIVLMSTGKVSTIEAVKVTIPDGTPDKLTDAFIREAVKAARKIKFDPAEKDGRKVSQYVFVEYNFTPS